MVASDAQPKSRIPPNVGLQFVDKSGILNPHSAQHLQQVFNNTNGITINYSCTETFSGNVYTLTPFSISPTLPSYLSYSSYTFVATDDSTGAVTATVAPASGALATLKVYVAGGATQATTGDIFANILYTFVYNDALDSGNGGFVLFGGQAAQAASNTPIRCTCANSGNVYTLTPSSAALSYATYDQYQFVCNATSTGSVTLGVSALAAKKVLFPTTGAQIGAGNLFINMPYIITFGSSLDGGAGAWAQF